MNTGCCAYIRTMCASAGEHQADRAKETGNPTRGLSHRTGILERTVFSPLELRVCPAAALFPYTTLFRSGASTRGLLRLRTTTCMRNSLGQLGLKVLS